MTRHSGVLLAAAALVAGCAPGHMAERPYPPTHPASAEAPPTPFVRPANLFTAAAMPAASGEAGPMAHAGMDHRDAMAHGGMDRMAGDHGAVAGSDRPRAANQTAQADSGAKPSGTGTVHSVDAERRIVNLSHDPIPAIGWPAMTMDMTVAPSVDLSAVAPGSEVAFTLERDADGLYMIDSLDLRPRRGTMPEMDHQPMHNGGSMPGMHHQ